MILQVKIIFTCYLLSFTTTPTSFLKYCSLLLQFNSIFTTWRGTDWRLDKSSKNYNFCVKFRLQQNINSVKHLSRLSEIIVCKIDIIFLLIFGHSHLQKKFCFICFIENPLKMIKTSFYFLLKGLLVLKIFKFLS